MIRALLLLAALLLAAPAGAAGPRVVSLGGAVTETVFALGAGDALVGTDLTSRFPGRAAALPHLGYLRALGAEGVLSLRPTLVLASGDAGPPAALRQVAAAGVALVRLPEAHGAAAALARVRAIGTALGRPAEADALARRLQGELDAFAAALATGLATGAERPRVLFLLSLGSGAPMAAGAGTAADAMIRLAGGRNVLATRQGYRPIGAEALVQAAPEVILTTAERPDGADGLATLRALPGLAATPAGRAGRLAAFDALYLLGFGPRLPAALRDLALVLHPGLPLAGAGR